MQPTVGPAALGAEIRRVYQPLFAVSHEPFRETGDELRRLFNIHSGGSDQVIKFQMNTFTALCEFATFNPNG
jgi:hypothetical protein